MRSILYPPPVCAGWIPTGLHVAYTQLGHLTTTGAPFFIRENTRPSMIFITGTKDACIPLIHHLMHTEMHLQRSVLLFGELYSLPKKILSHHPSPMEWNLHVASHPFPGEAILPSILGDILASGIGVHQKNLEQICTLRGICALVIRKIRAKGMLLHASLFLQILEDSIKSASILKDSTHRFHTAWNRLSKETQDTFKSTLRAWISLSPITHLSSWMQTGGLAFLSESHPIHEAILLRRLLLLKSLHSFSPLLSLIFPSSMDPTLIDHLLKFPHVRSIIWHPQPPTHLFHFHEIRHITTLRKQSIFRYIPNPSSLKGTEFLI